MPLAINTDSEAASSSHARLAFGFFHQIVPPCTAEASFETPARLSFTTSESPAAPNNKSFRHHFRGEDHTSSSSLPVQFSDKSAPDVFTPGAVNFKLT